MREFCESRGVSLLTLSSFNIELPILGVFPFRINFRISLSISTNYLAGIFIGIALNYRLSWEETDILTLLSLHIHEHGISLHLFSSSLISFIRGW